MKTDRKQVELLAAKTDWTEQYRTSAGYWNAKYERGSEMLLVRFGPKSNLVTDLRLYNRVTNEQTDADKRGKADQLINILIRDER